MIALLVDCRLLQMRMQQKWTRLTEEQHLLLTLSLVTRLHRRQSAHLAPARHPHQRHRGSCCSRRRRPTA